jgi:hypothetical protein
MCYHEAIYNNQELTGYKYVGTADCGYCLCPEWVEEIGEHKLVVIHRDYKQVEQSLGAIGYPDSIGYLPELAKQLHQLDGLHVDFNDIDKQIMEIHDYLGVPGYDKNRAELFKDMNIQSTEWSK